MIDNADPLIQAASAGRIEPGKTQIPRLHDVQRQTSEGFAKILRAHGCGK